MIIKNLSFYLLLLILSSIASISFTSDTQAVEFPNGKVAFEKSPLLVNAHTTFSGVRVRQAVYYFNLEIPEDAGESLQQIKINQRQGADKIRFRLDETRAFMGEHRRKQEPLTFASVTQDESTDMITVTFANPIPPGNKFTLGLKPRRNPDFGGVYLFGITAFPAGEQPIGLYLGAGRLHFYQGRDRFFGY